ncbi:DUF4407 domain-containing protein [Undibacterium terreum]|uniref:DUF4407 domain-containing protein n=1 Tax=Undibacterium terreum TaxID=1224302 RepID=A0A916XC47_9BURK|nr:DUF4407 domain-containing protein [Undibacterium terreum]GGC63054.1 hypothetical protein GCM10011396_07520 [Undibacterium terreum]
MPNSITLLANLKTSIKKFLALSATISLDTLEEKDEQGNHRFARGRHKYYGIGALVIFFAIFSGYGMAHMLGTMAGISALGAVVGGVLWGGFQWLLERQIMMSVAPDARVWAKLFGFGWRSLIAMLSVVTMVYPFFVESNRAEIDVRAGEIAHARLIDNVRTSQQAAGVPALQAMASVAEQKLQRAEAELAGDPPELPALRQQARVCWVQLREAEVKTAARLSQLEDARRVAADAAALNQAEAGIAALAAKRDSAKNVCRSRDRQIADKLAAWKTEKSVERQAIVLENRQIDSRVEAAGARGRILEGEQAARIEKAANSGFAADFEAVWDMLQHDASRRVQFIWWFAWFLSIELIVMIVKLSSLTDLDYRLGSDESLFRQRVQLDLELRQAELQTAGLRARMQARGTQAALQQDEGRVWQEMESQALQLGLYKEQIKLPAELAEAALQQMLRIQDMDKRGAAFDAWASLDAVMRRMLQDLENFSNDQFVRNKGIKLGKH